MVLANRIASIARLDAIGAVAIGRKLSKHCDNLRSV